MSEGADAFSITSKKPPAFDTRLPVGQLYFPSFERYEDAMRGIFERKYYTNHGPLARRLEEELVTFLGVKHAICVTNATIGLMMVAEALEISGNVIVPAHTFVASAQSIKWCGLTPRFCDVDPLTQQIDVKAARALIDADTSAILAVNLWGGACDIAGLASLSADSGIHVYFDSAHAFGAKVKDIAVGRFGRAEVFSFHATKVISAGEGGCVTTNDDDLAAKLRNIRSSYGAGDVVSVRRTTNGRMSEAQAAIALLSLEDYPMIRAHNKALFEAYRRLLASVPGITLLPPTNVTDSNYQYAACTIDESEFGLTRDQILALLQAENIIARRYFYPGIHRSAEFKAQDVTASGRLLVTEMLSESGLQLPLGARVGLSDVTRIAEIITRAHDSAGTLLGLIPREI